MNNQSRYNRRTFLATTVTGVGAAALFGGLRQVHVEAGFANPAASKFQTLIAGQYANDLKLIEQIGGRYFGPNFTLSDTPSSWTLQLGRYPGRYNGCSVDLHGYWIFLPGARKCWQAVERGGGELRYWNQDGQARGNPEDWELFTFEAVDPSAQTVKIANASYVPFRTCITGHVPNPRDNRNYINLVGNRFSCNDNAEHAAVFRVEFPA